MKNEFNVFFQNTKTEIIPNSVIDDIPYLGRKCVQIGTGLNWIMCQFEDGFCFPIHKDDLRPYTKLDGSLK